MPGYRARVRNAQDRVFAPSVQQTSSEVGRILLPELAELRRILGDQGDAADEIAEITGRTLTRLSDEIADVRAAVAALQLQLDQSRDHPARDPDVQDSTAQDAPARDPAVQDPAVQDPAVQDPDVQDAGARDSGARDSGTRDPAQHDRQ